MFATSCLFLKFILPLDFFVKLFLFIFFSFYSLRDLTSKLTR